MGNTLTESSDFTIIFLGRSEAERGNKGGGY